MNGPSEPFRILSITLDGGPYKAYHGISLRKLSAFAALEEAVLAAAMDVWREANPDRGRREFNMGSLDLRLATLTKSSSAALIEAVSHPQPATKVGLRKNAAGRREAESLAEKFRERGLDELASVLGQISDAPEEEGPVDSPLTTPVYVALEKMFEQLIGNDDRVTADVTIRMSEPCRITLAALARIRREARRRTVPAKVEQRFIVGRVAKVQTNGKRTESITMEKREGEDTILLPLPAKGLDAFAQALTRTEDRSVLARVRCKAMVRENGRIESVKETHEISWISGPDLEKRVQALLRSVDSWEDDGQGASKPTKSSIRRAADLVWFVVESVGVDRPFIYTTFNGDVQAEWDFPELRGSMQLTASTSMVSFCASWDGSSGLTWLNGSKPRPDDVGAASPMSLWAGAWLVGQVTKARVAMGFKGE